MDSIAIIDVAPMLIAGLAVAAVVFAPAFGEGRAVARALGAIARQPTETAAITRRLFVGLVTIESTAIYVALVATILIFTNPFWEPFAALPYWKMP